MIASGMNANMKNVDSVMHDGSVLEYSRIKNMTIQAWSPFQYGFFKGTFIAEALIAWSMENADFEAVYPLIEKIIKNNNI